MFAIEKAADEACPNLNAEFRCNIHDNRITLGYRGCTLFDCHGAGQRTTALYPGQDWRSDKVLATDYFESFRKMLKIHDYLRLILALETLPLEDLERSDVARFKSQLAPEKDWTRESLADFEVMRIVTEFEMFAAKLKDSPAAKALRARFSNAQ